MGFQTLACLWGNTRGQRFGATHGGLDVKNLPGIKILSLGQEDPLEKGMAIHSSILGWKIPWTEEPGGLQSMESQRVRYN